MCILLTLLISDGVSQPGSGNESFGMIFTFVYMILTNILMLNLLIARFK